MKQLSLLISFMAISFFAIAQQDNSLYPDAYTYNSASSQVGNMAAEEYLAIFIVLIVLWAFLREVNCWYWKINKRIELLEKNNKLLKEISLKIGTDNNSEVTDAVINYINRINQEPAEKTSVNDPDVLDAAIKYYNKNKL